MLFKKDMHIANAYAYCIIFSYFCIVEYFYKHDGF